MANKGDLSPIISVVEDVLGHSRRGVNPDGWTEYDCPNCASIAGNSGDGKYNLCVNYRTNTYHCWKCLEKGRLSKLMRLHGGGASLYAYNDAIRSIRASGQYRLGSDEVNLDFLNIENITLPKQFKPLNPSDPYAKDALTYLYGRGITDKIIERYNIGYIGYFKSDDRNEWKLRNKIIVPSQDAFGSLNYWIARDYTGKARQKYHNANVEKKHIVFNEGLVNWYEDVTLVEGVFDHFAVPNSIPLLGKSLPTDCATYETVTKNAQANVSILLDDDASDDAIRIYRTLNKTRLKGRVRLIFCPDGYDAALAYEKFGKRGISVLLRRAMAI
ncbi:MAG: hypothetical protein LUD72_01555 [Bacteroidales bacterium]|nr:hypothetical protein [Bacteroidales bacterium]